MPHNGFTHESTHNETHEWYTPRPIFDALGLEFDMDVCSPGADIVPWIPAKDHVTVSRNGLSCEWSGRVWMNPPYGQETPFWMKRFAEHRNGVALVFSRTDTSWFHEWATRCDALLFLRGRIAFIPADPGKKASSAGCGSLLCACGDASVNAIAKMDGFFMRVKDETRCE